MKILVINTVPMEINGITNVIVNLYKKSLNDQLHMDFVSINECNHEYKELFERNGSKLFYVPNRLTRPVSYLKRLSEIAKGYDIVHAHGNSATLVIEMLAGKMAGVPVRIAHSHNSCCKYVFIDKVCKPLFLHLCNGHLACSDIAGRWLFGRKKFTVIKNGIDCKQYAFSDEKRVMYRKKMGWENEVIIGHVGSFNTLKNQKFIIQLFAEIYRVHKNYKLLLIGDGELKSESMELVKKHGLESEVCFYGNCNNVNEILNAIDLIIMPSLNEGFPLTLLEEQANGLPCIISDNITKDVNITGDIRFLSLKDGISCWKKEVEKIVISDNREEISKENIKKIVAAGYDSEKNIQELKKYYIRGIKKYGTFSDN